MTTPLRILLIDDNPDDRALILRGLQQEFDSLEVNEITQAKNFKKALKKKSFDLVITENKLKWTNGIDILRTVKAQMPNCPVVMFTATGTEETVVEAMKNGLDDYVLKTPTQFTRLSGLLRNIIEQDQQRKALREAEARYQSLFEGIPLGLYRISPDGEPINVNKALVDMFGYPDRQTLLNKKVSQHFVHAEHVAVLRTMLDRQEQLFNWETEFIKYNGRPIWVNISGNAIFDDWGKINYIEGSIEDITERKEAEQAIARQLQELTVLNAIASATATATTVDMLIEEATQIIGKTLYPDNFGFGLTDFEAGVIRIHPSYHGIDRKFIEQPIPLDVGISGQVIASGKARRVADVTKEPNYLEYNPPTRSELCVPIKAGERILGLINAESTKLNAFSESDEQLLTTIADQLGTALEKLQLFEAERRQRQQAETLQEVAAILSAATDKPTVLDVILEQLKRVVSYDSASVQIIKENVLVIEAVAGNLSPEELIGYTIKIEEDVIAHPIIYNLEAKMYPDVRESPHWLSVPGAGAIRSWIGVPLVSRGECLGVLTVDSYQAGYFNHADMQLTTTFAHHAAIAIENARLITEITDSLSREQQLGEITRTINSALDITEVLERIGQLAAELVGAEIARIDLLDPQKLFKPIETFYYNRPEDLEPIDIPEGHGVGGEIIKTGKPVLVSNYSSYPTANPGWVKVGIQGVMGIPLKVGDTLIGVLILASSNPQKHFTPRELELIEPIGHQAGVAIQNARLFEEIRQTLDRERQLNEITRSISSALDIPQILSQVAKLSAELIGADLASIGLVDPETLKPLDFYFHNTPHGFDTEPPPYGHGLMWEILQNGRPSLVSDYPDNPKALKQWIQAGVHGFLGVPLISGQKVIGILSLMSTDPEKQFNNRDLALCESIGRQAGVAIQNARLFEETRRQNQELVGMYELALATGSELDTAVLLKRLYQQVKQLMNPDSFGVFLYHEETNHFEIAIAMDEGQPISNATGQLYPVVEGGLTGWIMENRKTLLIDDTLSDPLPVEPKHIGKPSRSWLGVPLLVGERLIGVISVQSYQPSAFDKSNRRFLESLGSQVAVALENSRLYSELADSYVQTVLALANAMDARDTYTSDHSQRMAVLAEATGKEMGLDEEDLEALRWSALLHDIGKIGVPDEILLKPSRLDDEELATMRLHPEIGANIIAPIKRLVNVAPIIRAHQEWYDGNGYPEGMKGEAIPLGARILSVVDAYVAITDDRVYRKARSHQEAVSELERCSGTQFDPKAVNAFLEVLKRNHGISERQKVKPR